MANKSILVVGNDAHFCYLMQRYIHQTKHSSVLVTPGPQTLAVICKEKPIAVVVEVTSPDSEGWKIMQEIKTEPVTSQIPVVVCSWQEEQGKTSGKKANIFLHMPVLYEEFLKALTDIGLCTTTQT